MFRVRPEDPGDPEKRPAFARSCLPRNTEPPRGALSFTHTSCTCKKILEHRLWVPPNGPADRWAFANVQGLATLDTAPSDNMIAGYPHAWAGEAVLPI